MARLHKQHAYGVSSVQLIILKRLLHLVSNVSCACEVRGSQQGGQQASVAAWAEDYMVLIDNSSRFEGAATHLLASLSTLLGGRVHARAKKLRAAENALTTYVKQYATARTSTLQARFWPVRLT
jgi:hypothetical protein